MSAVTHPILLRTDYQLADNLTATSGQVFLTGIQALIRLLLMQRQLDAARGWNTAGFVSGYRGSPLGTFDLQLAKARPQLASHHIEFMPAINEDLAAAACVGTQQIEKDPKRTVDGVHALWYGKGPGLDRAGDAIKHGNASGSSPRGGVLVVVGDDHGCVSSSMPYQSDIAFQAWSMPVVHPANVAEYLEFGLYGWALSRFAGCWVGFKAISEVVESGMTVDLDRVLFAFEQAVPYTPPACGLHSRWPEVPSATIEERMAARLQATRAFARVNSIDRHIVSSPSATLGIITVGKAHFDFMEVLRRLDLDPDALSAAGVRVYKVGLVWPLEPTRIDEFAQGLEEILVIEEKAPIVEQQLKELLYARPDSQRPRIAGKFAPRGEPLLSSIGELRPSRVIAVVAEWLARLNPALDRRHLVVDFTMPKLLSNEGDGVRRTPYFCAGCPHSTSTKLPEGSRAIAGIGCHFMASWMNRETGGFLQMGGEGVDWVAHSRFTAEKHIFQNLGDGTYHHSGYLAIRQAIAADATMTYKILYNDAVAMTGGQAVDGKIGVPEIARQVEAEGAKRVVVVSDEPEKFDGRHGEFPRGTTFHHRRDLDVVQRELREIAGVTVLIYDQTCAAEKRRRRKKNAFPDPPQRVFINEAVCEGCGDCGVQSNCLAVIPVETDWGRKRQIDQTACNKDFSCINGFCPSFVTVHGAAVRKREGSAFTSDDLAREIAMITSPPAWHWTGPFDLLVTGVGGTGVVTVGALVAMAAHLESKQASVLDFTGFAQKGGAVLSYIRIALTADALNQVRIDTQQADCLLACDLVVGASNDALQTVKRERTAIIANTHTLATANFVLDPHATLHAPALLAKMRYAAGDDLVTTIDAQAIAERLLGDTMPANIVMLGFCWQRGLVPVSTAALMRAFELNGVAVELNKTAFSLGRLAAASPAALDRLVGTPAPQRAARNDWDDLDGVDGLIARRSRHLTQYQNAAYANHYRTLVDAVRSAESAIAPTGPLKLTAAVARQFAKLLAYKDEYEVARLYTDGAFAEQIREQFSGWSRLSFHMAPPLITRAGRNGEPPRKIELGRWILPAMRLLAKAKRLRGTPFDVFGWTDERRAERALVTDYKSMIEALLPRLSSANLPLAIQIAGVPDRIRGYGHIKLASIAAARAGWKELHARFDAAGLDDAPRSDASSIGEIDARKVAA